MKVKFLKPRSIDGVDYSKGIHEVPDKAAKDWFFLACLNNGDLLAVEDAKKEVKAVEKQEPKKEEPKDYREHMSTWESKEDKKAQANGEEKLTPAQKRARTLAAKKAAKAQAQADA